jgi:hypothetical protein
MFGVEVKVSAPMDVKVQTTNNRGFTPEELAEQALDKIVSVSDNADPIVREQAHAFRERIRYVLIHYLKQAARSDRTTVCAALNAAGQSSLSEMIKRL